MSPTIATLNTCSAAGLPHLAAEFVRLGASLDQVRAKIDDVALVQDAYSAVAATDPTLGESVRDHLILALVHSRITRDQAIAALQVGEG